MSSHHHTLLRLLSEDRFYSGTELGLQLGISRSAVWKNIALLKERGLDVYTVPGRGYRLSSRFEPLNGDSIRAVLPLERRPLLDERLEIFLEINSTNQYLFDKAKQGYPSRSVCLAEYQSHGRGRRGRQWISPLGGNLYLSLLWRFALVHHVIGSLALACGVAVARVLKNSGVTNVQLKWPNDLYCNGKKLGGILLEMSGETSGPCAVVVGLGININMPHAPSIGLIDQPWIDLESILGAKVSRNELAGRLLDELFSAIELFETGGLSPFFSEWLSVDYLKGKMVTLTWGGRDPVTGKAVGIDAQGALLIEKSGCVRPYHSGEVSVSVAPQRV